MVDKYANCYNRTGQSEVFEATSEIKCFLADALKYPVLNESIKEFRLSLECENTDLSLFKSFLLLNKEKIEDYIRIANDIKTSNVNSVINRK